MLIQFWNCYLPTQFNQMWRIHWVSDFQFQAIGVANDRCRDATAMGAPAAGATPSSSNAAVRLTWWNQVVRELLDSFPVELSLSV